MITYEYYCPVCKRKHEIQHRITDDPVKECPNCKVAAMERLVSGGTGFVLKGGGWYKDGYTKDSNGRKVTKDE